MKKDNKTKKNSVMKKLVPATGMLLVSAIMLTTSTYAWFTMSREVEVTGIKMTASVPQGIEVSLGDGMLSSNDRHTLTVDTNSATNATRIKAPTNNSADLTIDKDWTNSVAVSDYYKFGYLIPASSINGTDVWYTNNANEAGRSVDVNATFAQADGGSNAYTGNSMTTYGVGSTYSTFDPEYATKGYYIDIPVWFRTSSTSNVSLAVVATISSGRLENGTVVGNEGDLYKAARVAILDANSAVNSESGSANEIVYGSNFYGATAGTGIGAIASAYYNRYVAAQNMVGDPGTATEITNPQAVKAAGSLNGRLATSTTAAQSITNAGTLYGTAAFVTQATQDSTTGVWSGDTVVTVTAASGTNNYGDAVEKTIRVWLEGEDVNCWNPNAGQSFTIDLKFVRTGSIDAATAANHTS